MTEPTPATILTEVEHQTTALIAMAIAFTVAIAASAYITNVNVDRAEHRLLLACERPLGTER